METVTYSDSIMLRVAAVDNQLTAYLSPDTPNGAKMAEVYSRFVTGFSTNVDDAVNLTPTITGLGGSATFAAIASNFTGAGAITFELFADGQSVYRKNTSLGQFSSQQWAVQIVKN